MSDDPVYDRLMADLEAAKERNDKAAGRAALDAYYRHVDRDAGQDIDEAVLRQLVSGFGWWGDGPLPAAE